MIWPSLKDVLLLVSGLLLGLVTQALIGSYSVMPKELTLGIDFGNLAVGIATTLVAFASFESIQSSTRSKIADDRVEWMGEIRKEIALYSSNLFLRSELSKTLKSLSSSDVESFMDKNASLIHGYTNIINISYANIKLMMDLKNDKHKALNEYIKKSIDEGDINFDYLDNYARDVIEEAWERSKAERKKFQN